MSDLRHLPEDHEGFTHLDEDHAKKLENKLSEHKQQKEKADEENYVEVSNLMGNTVENTDESIDTIYTYKQSVEKEIKTFKEKHHRLEEMEEEDKLTEVELKDKWKQLAIHLQQCLELAAYQVDVQDVRVDLLEEMLQQFEEKKYDKQTAKSMIELFNENHDEIENKMENRLNGFKSNIDSKVESEVTKETAEMREKLGMLQRDVEKSWELLEKFSNVAESQASQLEQIVEKTQNIEEVDDKTIAQLKDQIETLQNAAESESVNERPSQKKNTGQVQEDQPDKDVEETVIEHKESQDDGPRYHLKNRSRNEVKQTLEQVEQDLERGDVFKADTVDELSLNAIAKKSDSTHGTVKKKIKQTNQEYDENVLEGMIS